VPKGRSGHTLTYVGNSQYFLYGGIEDNRNGKIAPNGDIYMMKMTPKDDCRWYKESPNGDEKPLARSQHVALYGPDTSGRVFVFGGHHEPKVRLNDTWFFDVKALEWTRVGDEKDNKTNQESGIGAPNPRANAGACIYNGKIFLFGGHGGLNYKRESYNDLHSFDLETNQWERIVSNNNPPEPRGGHSVFAFEEKIYVYGGWN